MQDITKILLGVLCFNFGAQRYRHMYRHIWDTLQRRGIQVPRFVVQELMQYLDPEGCELRRAHRLRRRVYHNAGPNAVWHVDGYDKLKPYGFPIHGCIDGWSRKVLWFVVTCSHNYPDNIESYYPDAVEQYGGCPVELDTDLGTENGTMAAIQAFFFVMTSILIALFPRQETSV